MLVPVIISVRLGGTDQETNFDTFLSKNISNGSRQKVAELIVSYFLDKAVSEIMHWKLFFRGGLTLFFLSKPSGSCQTKISRWLDINFDKSFKLLSAICTLL